MSKKKIIILFLTITGIISIIFYKVNGGSICFFYNIYGIPCPTCGMTRAYVSLVNLDFKSAFHYHPLFWLVPLLAFTFIKNQKKYLYFIFFIFIVVWIIRMYFCFPNKVPLNFNKNALFSRVYRELFINK